MANVLGAGSGNVFGRSGYYAAAAVSVAVVVVFIQRRLAQGAVAELVVELGRRGRRRICANYCPARWAIRRWRWPTGTRRAPVTLTLTAGLSSYQRQAPPAGPP
jgi:hypothetical protein